MFMILLGIFWFGEAFSIYGTAARAAQEAALAAAESTCTTCAGGSTPTQNAYDHHHEHICGLESEYKSAKPTEPEAQSFIVRGRRRLSSATLTQPNICVQTKVQLSSTGGGAVGACGVSVSFTYRYQMWLPFTSLNNQAIQIRAAAQAPLESR